MRWAGKEKEPHPFSFSSDFSQKRVMSVFDSTLVFMYLEVFLLVSSGSFDFKSTALLTSFLTNHFNIAMTRGEFSPNPLRDSTHADPFKPCTILRCPFLVTDPKSFLKAPSSPTYINCEWGRGSARQKNAIEVARKINMVDLNESNNW